MAAWNGTLPTLTAGSKPTAAQFAELVNAVAALTGTWTSYTPTWTATGTAPAIGNGTLWGKYIRAGKFVRAQFGLNPGTTTTFGTGVWGFSLPITAAAAPSPGPTSLNYMTLGTAWLADASAGQFQGTVNFLSTTTVQIYAGDVAGAIGPATPFTWVSDDEVTCEIMYEAA